MLALDFFSLISGNRAFTNKVQVQAMIHLKVHQRLKLKYKQTV